MSGLSCPHCGKEITLSASEKSVRMLQDELARLRAALREAEAMPDVRRSIWDSRTSTAAFGADSLQRKKEVEALASWGFTKRKGQPKPARRDTPAEATSGSAPAAPVVKAERRLQPSTLLAALAAHGEINAGQAATIKMIYDRFAPRAPLDQGGASMGLSAALDADPNLNGGQRETLRTVVSRFEPKG